MHTVYSLEPFPILEDRPLVVLITSTLIGLATLTACYFLAYISPENYIFSVKISVLVCFACAAPRASSELANTVRPTLERCWIEIMLFASLILLSFALFYGLQAPWMSVIPLLISLIALESSIFYLSSVGEKIEERIRTNPHYIAEVGRFTKIIQVERLLYFSLPAGTIVALIVGLHSGLSYNQTFRCIALTLALTTSIILFALVVGSSIYLASSRILDIVPAQDSVDGPFSRIWNFFNQIVRKNSSPQGTVSIEDSILLSADLRDFYYINSLHYFVLLVLCATLSASLLGLVSSWKALLAFLILMHALALYIPAAVGWHKESVILEKLNEAQRNKVAKAVRERTLGKQKTQLLTLLAAPGVETLLTMTLQYFLSSSVV